MFFPFHLDGALGDAVTRLRSAISAAQRVEHYEIAAYGTVRDFANLMGESEAASLLEETLNEERKPTESLPDSSSKSTLVGVCGDGSEQRRPCSEFLSKSLISNDVARHTSRSPLPIQHMLYCCMQRLLVLFFTSVLSADPQGRIK